jgi:hypothetical protein
VEGEESPLLEVVTREQLVKKTQQAEKVLEGAVVIFELWRYKWHCNYL